MDNFADVYTIALPEIQLSKFHMITLGYNKKDVETKIDFNRIRRY
jgi:hypothetical protein